ncbi:MAG: hypothetical protein CMM50_03655 [Rhodospirillaceae bacterium]|nr:hypothetical protein [Rhodospirillaceae bacterium]
MAAKSKGPPPDAPFWRTKRLDEMTQAEWESLCDGCGKCCLLKLQDIDTERILYTDVACRMFDPDTCRCKDYPRRKQHVPECVFLSPKTLREAAAWLPSTCAYKLLYQGKDLPWWHPLVSGRKETVHLAGASARNRVISEETVTEEEIEQRIVRWASR